MNHIAPQLAFAALARILSGEEVTVETKKSRPVLAHKSGKRTRKEIWLSMSFVDFIRSCKESKAFYRKIIVRAIEDAIILFIICVSIAVVCYVSGSLLSMMGVN